MDLNVKSVKTTSIAEGNYSIPGNAQKCRYQATPTSGTLFHKVKFPMLKAFYIVYYMSTNKQGIASTELSRKTGATAKNLLAVSTKGNEGNG